MELEELKAEIEDLHTKRQFSAIKTILNQLNPADIAQLLDCLLYTSDAADEL